jgi:hypothetical protein
MNKYEVVLLAEKNMQNVGGRIRSGCKVRTSVTQTVLGLN